MLAITSIIVPIMHALPTPCDFVAFFVFTFYDFRLWLEKLAERLYYYLPGVIAPCYRCPKGSGRKISQNNLFG
jgi:hypothetical protein